jgi:hypothetical protein
MTIKVRALATGYDGVVMRELDDVFDLPDATIPGPWFEAVEAEGKALLAANAAADTAKKAVAGAALARRVTDRVNVDEAVAAALAKSAKPSALGTIKKSLAEAQAAEFELEKSQAQAKASPDLV